MYYVTHTTLKYKILWHILSILILLCKNINSKEQSNYFFIQARQYYNFTKRKTPKIELATQKQVFLF